MKYVVMYDGQVLTGPLDFETAHYIATMENLDATKQSGVNNAIAEVVITEVESDELHPH